MPSITANFVTFFFLGGRGGMEGGRGGNLRENYTYTCMKTVTLKPI